MKNILKITTVAFCFSTFLQAGDNGWVSTESQTVDLTEEELGIKQVPSLSWETGLGTFFSTLHEAEEYCKTQDARVPGIHEVYALYTQKNLLKHGSDNWHGSNTPVHRPLSIDFQHGNFFTSYAGTTYRCVRTSQSS